MKRIFTLATLLLSGNLLAQTPQDSVTIQGRVTDFDGNPIDSCSVMWQTPSFDSKMEVLTDSQGHYSARIPRGKYQSMAAIRMDTYPHTAKEGIPETDQRLEFWCWDLIADRDTTIDIRYHRMEAYGLRVFQIPGGMPTYQIYVRPMSLTRFQRSMKESEAVHGQDVSQVRQEAAQKNAKESSLAPSADQLKATVWIDGEKVTVLMTQEIKEYYSADEYGKAYLLTVDRPKRVTSFPYRVFKVELEDLGNGDRGEGLYYMEKESYVR